MACMCFLNLCHSLDCPTLSSGGMAGPRSFADPAKEEEWRACITRLATCPNVHMKVGGLQMDGNGFNIGPDAIDAPVSSDILLEKTGDIYNFMIDAFGGENGALHCSTVALALVVKSARLHNCVRCSLATFAWNFLLVAL